MTGFIPGAEPFELGSGKNGVLLVHGLTGSPYEMRPLGDHLASIGFSVLCPALAGHATRWEDLEKTSWKDWVESAAGALETLKTRCRSVCIAGISMGGLVTLELARRSHREIRAIAVIAAPLKLAGLNGAFAALSMYTPLGRFMRAVKKIAPSDPVALAISRQNPSYDRVPVSSAAELWKFMARMRVRAGEVKTPALVVYSRGDADVPFLNMHLMKIALGDSVRETLELSRSPHLVTLGPESSRVLETVGTFFNRHCQRRAR
jgi:carboxylesterase